MSQFLPISRGFLFFPTFLFSILNIFFLPILIFYLAHIFTVSSPFLSIFFLLPFCSLFSLSFFILSIVRFFCNLISKTNTLVLLFRVDLGRVGRPSVWELGVEWSVITLLGFVSWRKTLLNCSPIFSGTKLSFVDFDWSGNKSFYNFIWAIVVALFPPLRQD